MSDPAIAAAWPALVRAAIVGTQRARPSGIDSGDAEWNALLRGDPSTDEAAVLRAAAVIGLQRRAGRRPPLPASAGAPAAGPETLRRCGPAAAVDLVRIVEREARLLPEWLALAQRAQVRVPEEHLPLLFGYVAARPALQPAAVAIAGARGAWLGARFAEWSFAAGASDDPDAAWLHGDFAARLAAFAVLRRDDPHAARERLAATWEREPARERVAFIRALQNGLSDLDEPFLEERLDERRKDVRDAAAAMLARLPSSRLAARATAAAHASIALRKRFLQPAVLDVTLPQALPAELQRDVAELKPPHGIGERAWLLRQIVARVPPAQLVAGVDSGELLDLVRRSEHAPALLSGLAAATASYADERMRTAWIVAAGVAPELYEHAWTANVEAPWSEQRRDAIAALLAAEAPRALDFTVTLPGPWDARFSRAFLAYVRAVAGRVVDPGVWRMRRETFSEAALRIDPALADAGEEWPAAAAQEIARDVIDALYETVRFRAALRRNVESRT